MGYGQEDSSKRFRITVQKLTDLPNMPSPKRRITGRYGVKIETF